VQSLEKTLFHKSIAGLLTVLCFQSAVRAASPTTAQAIRAVTKIYDGLPQLLRITWSEGPEYPLGIQDSAFAIVEGKVVSAGGFSRHPKDIVAKYADAFAGEPSGFTRLAFLFDPSKPDSEWTRITDDPGPAKQAAATAVVGPNLYAMGGFNYTDPFTYTSTHRLRSQSGQWKWEKLECDLPWPICEAGTAVIDDKIYLFGGADFYTQPGAPDGEFNSGSARTGQPVGRGLLMLDTRHTEKGWQRLADIPGSPRFIASGAAAGGKVYVLGGVHHGKSDKLNGYHNVIDSWSYNPQRQQWSRLPDVPHGANRRVVVYKDRYLIMLSGYRYGTTWNLDGTVSDAHSPEEKAMPEMKDHFETTVLVLDSKTNQIGTADALLDKTSYPMAAVSGNTIYCLGGEGGYRLWHPAAFQIGKVEEIKGGK
jgi:N-acetylneuraminic acid mutarotase